MIFPDRRQAGQLLAEKLRRQNIFGKNTLVVSLPKGGVVTGGRIAGFLKIPHRVIIAKKICAPYQSELAIGALSLSQSSLFLNRHLIKELNISPGQLKQAVKITQEMIKKEKEAFKKMVAANLGGKTVIIVDDGAATGATLISAIRYIANQKPQQTIVALPVSPPETDHKNQKINRQNSYSSTAKPLYIRISIISILSSSKPRGGKKNTGGKGITRGLGLS